MLEINYIQTMLFTVLCICFIFYLVLGIYSYRRENKLKSNRIFFTLCISTCLWAIGFAFMLISPDIETANNWRIISALGWCSFSGLWISFALSLNGTIQNKYTIKIPAFLYFTSIMFLISICLVLVSDLILPVMGILIYPTGIITISIGMGGMWYAINKHKFMSISYELVSEYIFEAVNEPIFILGEDFFIQNCNKAALNITGLNAQDLKEASLESIIDFSDFNFESIMHECSVTNIEVNLHSENKEVALRLKSIIRSTDTISRIGGDEFIIILRNLQDQIEAEKTAAAVLTILSTVFPYKRHRLLIGASIGLSIFPEHGIDADMLIKKADFAMYEVKHKGGNGYKIYSSEMKEALVVNIMTAMETAL